MNIFTEELEEHKKTIEKIYHLNEIIIKTCEEITKAIKRGNKILIFGNGGSAADAQHMAGELINRFLKEREPYPAVALTTDTSTLTSISNDYSFEYVFSRQIKALAREGDIAIGITTSGNSENVIEGLKEARRKNCITVGLLGKDGGKAKRFCHYPLIVPVSSTPRIQEMHILIIHTICKIVEEIVDSA
ncbi:MAG: SIS domain-containing protein [Deltaproteobacteria bacterium]|nr:SIS domain-containing protein [Deltaproteobacteria bacterium]